MKNPWLWFFQLLLAVFFAGTGICFLVSLLGDMPMVVFLVAVLFLFSILLPFYWFLKFIADRRLVDLWLVAEHVAWILLLIFYLKERQALPVEPSDMIAAMVLLVSLIGLRMGTQDSFLKQDRYL